MGPAGANGTQIYSGTTTPASSTGNSGDYYLDLTTDVLYGPKTSSGWGSGVSLMGQSGAAGKAGSQIYSGSGTPSTSTGITGDYYLDATNYVLYGPKTSSGWGTGIVLKGATGTANVIYSAWGYGSNPRDTTIDQSKLWVVNFPASALSQVDLSTASIQVYLQFGGGEEVLPYIAYAGSVNSTLSFIPETGTILITRYTSDNSGSIEIPLSLQYRYVIIPGGVQGTRIVDPYATELNPLHF
ncbi:hypothetical protein GCM10011511_31050 [Puia dinghuensis]|uniref:Uncharacterized protein n=1 Tax=Puia dinghuensis TaxID=1792502 RepID=A0A8J2UEJ3_9BACT|nr:hypothetical protein GCM10011511_31050 [Puia dinghuensis]